VEEKNQSVKEDEIEEEKKSEGEDTGDKDAEEKPETGDEVIEINTCEDKKVESEDNKENKYYVYVNLNGPVEEDYTFLLTALYHWEKKYPSFTKDRITDPSLITLEIPKQTSKVSEIAKQLEEAKNKDKKKDKRKELQKMKALMEARRNEEIKKESPKQKPKEPAQEIPK
jgi:hypothetical protein